MSRKKKHSKLSKWIGSIGQKERELMGTGLKQVGKDIGKAAKKVGQGLKHPFDAIKKLAKNATDEVKFAPLLPFKGMMAKALTKRGVSHGKSLPDIAFKFYVNVIHEKHHLDENAVFDAAKTAAGNSGVPGGALAVEIIHKIVDFIKGLQKKDKAHDAGQDVKVSSDPAAAAPASTTLTNDEAKLVGTDAPTDEEKDMAKEANQVQDKLAVTVKGGSVDSNGNVHGVPPSEHHYVFSSFFEDVLHIHARRHRRELVDWVNTRKEGTSEKKAQVSAAVLRMTPAEVDTLYKYIFVYDMGKNKTIGSLLKSRAETIIAKYKIAG